MSDPATYFAVFDGTGQILRSGRCPLSLVAAQAVSTGESTISIGQMVVDTQDWVNNGAVEQRPGLADLPATKALAVDEDWPIAGIPDGTEIWVDGALAGTVDATGLTLSFPLAATWQLRLVPPFPWKPADCEVTVS